MEHHERAIIEQLLKNDIRLKRLYEQHHKLEQKLVSFKSKTFLTPQEQIEEQALKKQKLHGVDTMMQIVAQGQEAA